MPGKKPRSAKSLWDELEKLRDRVACDNSIKVGSREWDDALARCAQIRLEVAALKGRKAK